jgi:hypothetical protein
VLYIIYHAKKQFILPGVLTLISIMVYFTAYNRAAFLSIMLVLTYWIITIVVPKTITFFENSAYYLIKIGIFLLPISMYLMSFFYSPSNPILVAISSFLSGRIRMGHEYVIDYGVKLFGQQIQQISQFSSNFKGVEMVLDSFYLKLIIQYGAIITLIFIIYIWTLASKLKNKKPELLVIMFFTLITLMFADVGSQIIFSYIFIIGVLMFDDRSIKMMTPKG